MDQFEFEVNPEFPGTGSWGCPTFAFSVVDARAVVEEHGDVYDGPAHATVVRVTTASGQWVGFFQAGMGGITRAMTAPDPQRALVLAAGDGYLVPVSSPLGAELVNVRMPIRAVVPVQDAHSTLLVSWTDVTALGTDGVLWRTRRLCLDDLEVEHVGQGLVHLRGTFEDISDGTMVVDLGTGEQVGGRVLPEVLH